MQTGLGPFLAAYLASSGWSPARVGYALTFGGLVTVAMQTPAGAVVDAAHNKRALVAVNIGALVCGALLLMLPASTFSVYGAQLLIGGAAPFLGPAAAAMALGMVGASAFDRQFGRNQSFNAAGNVCTALLVIWVSFRFGYRAIFAVAIAMALPSLISLFAIDGRRIDYAQARGAADGDTRAQSEGMGTLMKDGVLVAFLVRHSCFIWRTRPCCRNWARCWPGASRTKRRPSCRLA